MERVESRIVLIRGKKVMLDKDLAELYEVQTYQLKRSVKRNLARFPDDFMFFLTKEETDCYMRSQIGSSSLRRQNGSSSWGGTRYLPMAFTEQGVAMLSSVLHSERAIMVNIQIMRTFTKLRDMISSHEDLRLKLELLEKRYDEQFSMVFDALRKMIEDDEEESKSLIGFKVD